MKPRLPGALFAMPRNEPPAYPAGKLHDPLCYCSACWLSIPMWIRKLAFGAYVAIRVTLKR